MFHKLFLNFFITMLLCCTAASAQTNNCGPREDVLDNFKSAYGEILGHSGITVSGVLLEILVNPKTRPNGLTCLIDHGSDWSSDLYVDKERAVNYNETH